MKIILIASLTVFISCCCPNTDTIMRIDTRLAYIRMDSITRPLTPGININMPLLYNDQISVQYVTNVEDSLEADSLRKYISRLRGYFNGTRKRDSIAYMYIDTTLHVYQRPPQPSWIERQAVSLGIIIACLIIVCFIILRLFAYAKGTI